MLLLRIVTSSLVPRPNSFHTYNMAAYGRGKNTDMIFDRKTNPFEDDYDEEFEKVDKNEVQRQIRQAQDRSVASTMRSLALIEDSHDMAVKTADELQCQGEQLYRIERNLDDIQNNLAVSDRHVKSMKSVWGAMANYFKKPPKPVSTTPDPKQDVHSSGRKASDLLSESSMRFRMPEKETDEFGYNSNKPARASSSRDERHGQFQQPSFAFASSRDPQEKQLAGNLDLISRGIGLLKEDALTLGDEIERQNYHMDRIQGKSDVAYDKLEIQEKSVRRLLRK